MVTFRLDVLCITAIPNNIKTPECETDHLLFITSLPFLKNGGRYCFVVRRHICHLRRLGPRFALYLGCY